MVRRVAVILAVVAFSYLGQGEPSIDTVNYGIVNTLLQSPIRKEVPKEESVLDIGVARDFSDKSRSSYKPIVVGPIDNSIEDSSAESSNLDDVTIEEEPKKEETSAYDDTFKSITDIYQECSQKIDKRIESVLSWKFSKSNSEKDLIQLKDYVVLLYKCLKVQSFRYLDKTISDDVIPVTPFAELVRDGRSFNHDSNTVYMGPEDINGKLSLPWRTETGRLTNEYVEQIVDNDWSTLLLDRMSKLLESHSMKFNLNENAVQGRGRRRREHRMFAMMVMGFMVMATILVPMGFQFLTVLGGKSLLMAKMALIMSAINGLKKIATSQVGYGFYHTGPDVHHDHHHGFHDKLFKVKGNPPEFL